MSTFGGLLAGHCDEHHEVFQHLQACGLSADAAARVASLLEALGGSQSQLRAAHSAWGFAQREHGRPVNAEKMKDALRQKLLTLLPPLPLVAGQQLLPQCIFPEHRLLILINKVIAFSIGIDFDGFY